MTTTTLTLNDGWIARRNALDWVVAALVALVALARRPGASSQPDDEEDHADHGHDGPARAFHQAGAEASTLPATAAARSTCSAYSANWSA